MRKRQPVNPENPHLFVTLPQVDPDYTSRLSAI
jgi:hypothetical protein